MDRTLQDNSKLKGFTQHGVSFTGMSGNQAIGTCPFCQRNKKFYVNIETRAWDCKRCGKHGGFFQFLKRRSIDYVAKFRGRIARKLSEERGLSVKALKEWSIGWDGERYTIPVNAMGTTTDIRRYKLGKKCISTAGGKITLAGVDEGSSHIWLCEGEWDGITLTEILGKINVKESVYAVSGAGTFPKNAAEFFQGKDVTVIFDNDDAGAKGEQRAFNFLTGYVNNIDFLQWPETLPDGFDLRDLYSQENQDPIRTMRFIRDHRATEPRETTIEKADATPEIHASGKGMKPDRVIKEYRKWLKIRHPEILSVLFGTVFANRLDGDPLWLFIVAPPGGMKTELIMSMNDAPLIVTTSSLTPQSLVSGANFTGGDPSLIPKLDGKVLSIKDFTTILGMQVGIRDEIFGILRDAYDGKIEKIFGNGVWRHYESKFGIIAGVTPMIETFSSLSSALGERFIKYKIREPGKITVGKEMIRQALKNVAKESKMREDLRSVGTRVLDWEFTEADVPTLSDDMIERFTRLAQWIASLRGAVNREKYTGEVLYKPTAEIGTRLAKQLCKLAMGIAIFHRESTITEETYRIILDVAKDTAPDRVEEIVKQLMLKGDDRFVSTKDISEWTRFPQYTITKILQDLTMLHVVQKEPGRTQGFWRVSKKMKRLMEPLGLYKEEVRVKKAKRRIKKKRRG